MSKELEARLDAIESRLAIDALIANYAEAFDTMNIDLLATLWHPESRLLLGANGNSDGLEAILAQARINMKRMPHMHHWMANALVTVDGDNAHGLVAAEVEVLRPRSGLGYALTAILAAAVGAAVTAAILLM